MRAAVVGSMVLVAALSLASRARASCIAEPVAELLWSFPADGDDDVPRNTLLWVVLSLGHRATAVRLDGVALDVADAPQFGPALAIDLQQFGLLATGDHTLELELPGAAAPATVAFAVGTNSAEPPAIPDVAAVRESEDGPTGICGSILGASECFDVGQDTHFIAEASDAPLAYVVKPSDAEGTTIGAAVFWPAECGAPTFFGHSFAGACLSVSAVGAAGASAPSERVCVDGDRTDSSGGCAASDGGAAFALLALLRILRR